MQKIDRAKFFDGYRKAFGSLTQKQVDGIESLLSSLEADEKVTDLRHAAYMLATVKHECGDEWHPIKEYGEGTGHKYGLKDPATGQRYFGRGYTQNTWKENYQMLTDAWNRRYPACKLDFVSNPDLLLQPEYSYFAMSYGVRTGAYTGVALKKYIHDDVCDFEGARRVINGTDCAKKIAGYANKLLEVVTASIV